MSKYNSCTEYWLDTQTGVFRGEFEQMYRNIEDPWGCQAGHSSLNNRIFEEVIFDGGRHYGRMLDIGCGLGGLMNAVKSRNGDGYVLGLDVSETAVRKAAERYPDMDFLCHDILRAELPQGEFDLVIMSEVLWYILEDLPLFFLRVANMMSATGVLAIHQYFPAEQRFGKETVDGLQGFLVFLEGQAGFARKDMVTSHHHDGIILLSTFERVNDARL